MNKIETTVIKYNVMLADLKACHKFLDLSYDPARYRSKHQIVKWGFQTSRKTLEILVHKIHKKGSCYYGMTEQIVRIKNLIHA